MTGPSTRKKGYQRVIGRLTFLLLGGSAEEGEHQEGSDEDVGVTRIVLHECFIVSGKVILESIKLFIKHALYNSWPTRVTLSSNP